MTHFEQAPIGEMAFFSYAPKVVVWFPLLTLLLFACFPLPGGDAGEKVWWLLHKSQSSQDHPDSFQAVSYEQELWAPQKLRLREPHDTPHHSVQHEIAVFLWWATPSAAGPDTDKLHPECCHWASALSWCWPPGRLHPLRGLLFQTGNILQTYYIL